MKSIIKDLELTDGRSLYVQIGESGRVSLSFDGTHTSIAHSMTVGELAEYSDLIKEALAERQAQVREELNV